MYRPVPYILSVALPLICNLSIHFRSIASSFSSSISDKIQCKRNDVLRTRSLLREFSHVDRGVRRRSSELPRSSSSLFVADSLSGLPSPLVFVRAIPHFSSFGFRLALLERFSKRPRAHAVSRFPLESGCRDPDLRQCTGQCSLYEFSQGLYRALCVTAGVFARIARTH